MSRYTGTEDDQKIQMAFTKKQVEARKDWLTQGMLERRERREAGLFVCLFFSFFFFGYEFLLFYCCLKRNLLLQRRHPITANESYSTILKELADNPSNC